MTEIYKAELKREEPIEGVSSWRWRSPVQSLSI